MLHQIIKPMLLHHSPSVPDDDKYIHQLKWDGHRALFHVGEGARSLYTRHGTPCMNQYPELQKAAIHASNAILDGEMIAFGAEGKPCFESVMERFSARRAVDRLIADIPAVFVAFDILYVNGEDITHLPLVRRIERLQEVVEPSPSIAVSPISEEGRSLWEAVKTQGLEGIVSKKKGSRYRVDTRSDAWLKTKNYQYETVHIVGVSKREFSWLLQKDGQHVGTLELAPAVARQAFAGLVPQIKSGENDNYVFVEPVIRCRVKFQCYTKKGLLRTPSFMEFVI